MGKATLELEGVSVVVELPDDVIREFILKALYEKLEVLPKISFSAKATPSADAQPATQDDEPQKKPEFLTLSRKEKEQRILEVIKNSSDRICTSMIAERLGVNSRHIVRILADLHKQGMVSRERVQVVGKAYSEFAYSIPAKSDGDIELKPLEDAILDVLRQKKAPTRLKHIKQELEKKGILAPAGSIRMTLQKLIKKGLVVMEERSRAHRYSLARREYDEKDILREYYLEGRGIEDIAREYGITPEEVYKVVNSERGRRYAEVNAELDIEKLQKRLKKEVELMKELTRDSEAAEMEASL